VTFGLNVIVAMQLWECLHCMWCGVMGRVGALLRLTYALFELLSAWAGTSSDSGSDEQLYCGM
jgi:hypothetical protein